MNSPLHDPESSSPLLKPTSDLQSNHHFNHLPSNHSDSDTNETETTIYDTHEPKPPYQSHRDSSPDSPSTRSRRPLCSLLLNILTTLLALYGLYSLLLPLFPPSESQNPNPPRAPDPYRPWTLPSSLSPNCTCPPHLPTALSQNCTYDALAAAWLPPHCRDEALTSEFTRSGPGVNGSWAYYADANGTVVTTVEEIAAMGEKGKFWVDRDWHLAHCVFYWEKYMRLRMTGKVLEERFDNVPHVRHCGRLLRKGKPEGRVLVEVDVVMDSRLDLGTVEVEHGGGHGEHGDSHGEKERGGADGD